MNFILHLVDDLRDRRALYIDQVEARQVVSVCKFECIDERLARARLRHSQEATVLEVRHQVRRNRHRVVDADRVENLELLHNVAAVLCGYT